MKDQIPFFQSVMLSGGRFAQFLSITPFVELNAGTLAKGSPRLLMVILESCFFKEDL